MTGVALLALAGFWTPARIIVVAAAGAVVLGLVAAVLLVRSDEDALADDSDEAGA